jgi:hypothetical protein
MTSSSVMGEFNIPAHNELKSGSVICSAMQKIILLHHGKSLIPFQDRVESPFSGGFESHSLSTILRR